MPGRPRPPVAAVLISSPANCPEELAPAEVDRRRGGGRRRRGRRRGARRRGGRLRLARGHRDGRIGGGRARPRHVGRLARPGIAGGVGQSGTSMRDGPSVLDDAGHSPALEPVAALEELELDQEREADHLALEPLDQFDRAVDRAAGREQVVDDQDLLTRRDRVAVDLERVRAVFERIFDGDRLGRQLAQLADGDETRRPAGRPSAR